MRNNLDIRINQTLHGYFSGHSLLASSYSLNPTDERRMLILSDMSGASMTRGFETYITGYRLAKEPIYVLAKTWYAPEMERPGCVWTHSLLIGINELGSISMPQGLLRFFERPNNDRGHERYSKPLSIESVFLNRETFSFDSRKATEIAEIISSLYENPSKQIFIAADKASLYEDLVLKVWEYQGARTRQKFAFCTGAISDRSSVDISFDVQIIPQKNLNRIEKENKNQLIIQLDRIRHNDYPDWVENLVWKYMFEETSSDLKLCLNEWDLDIQNSRRTYVKLLRIYYFYRQVINGEDSMSRLINLIANEFPGKDDAVALKAFFLDGHINKGDRGKWQDDVFLQDLFLTRNFSAFDSIRPNLKAKAGRFLDESSLDNLEKLLSKILLAEHNQLSDVFVEGIAEHIDSNKLGVIARNSESLLRIMIYSNPFLGVNPIIWNTNEIYQQERLSVLASSPKTTALIVKDVVWYLLETKKSALAYKVFNSFGDVVVGLILDWVDQHVSDTNFELGKEWKEQLSLRPMAVMDWLTSLEREINPKDGTLAWVAQLLNPISDIVKEHGIRVWLSDTKLDLLKLSDGESIEYAVFLLAIALNSGDLSSGELIAKTFLTVYNAARDNKLSYESWQRISETLPEVPWYQYWDKCERLRRGLVKKYSVHEIKTDDFIKATNQADVFEEIMQYSLEHKQVRNLIKYEILNKQAESIKLSDTQQKILRKYFY